MTAYEQIIEVDTKLIHISKLNTRIPTPGKVKASGLVESIKTQGQLTPGIARPHPSIEGEYELIAGARRYVACKTLGIPQKLIIRNVDDNDLEDQILTENLQRQDPEPQAEAKLIKRRLAEGMEPGEIAAKYGKSELWVKRRMKLLDVIPSLRKLFKGDLCHYTIEMQERIGSLSKESQKQFEEEWGNEEPNSLKGLNDFLSNGANKLEGCDWINDPDTKHGSCGPGCETDTNKTLFPLEGCKAGACTNEVCFNFRRGLAFTKAVKEAVGDQPLKDLVFFSQDYVSDLTLAGEEFRYFRSWDFDSKYTISKKDTDLIGLDITEPMKPKKVFLLVKGNKKKSATTTKDVNGTTIESDTPQERLIGRRLALLNKQIGEALQKAPVPTTVPMLELVALFGTMENKTYGERKDNRWKELGKKEILPLSGLDRRLRLDHEGHLWRSVKRVLTKRLGFNKNSDLLDVDVVMDQEKIAWLIGFDYKAAYETICTKNLPVPKSWKGNFDPITLQESKD